MHSRSAPPTRSPHFRGLLPHSRRLLALLRPLHLHRLIGVTEEVRRTPPRRAVAAAHSLEPARARTGQRALEDARAPEEAIGLSEEDGADENQLPNFAHLGGDLGLPASVFLGLYPELSFLQHQYRPKDVL